MKPSEVYANTGVSPMMLPFMLAIVLFPIPVYIEYRCYKKFKIENPFKKSFRLNLISSSIGYFPTILTFVVPITLYRYMSYSDKLFRIIIAYLLHLSLTVIFEFLALRILKYKIPFRILFGAQLYSYLVIVILTTVLRFLGIEDWDYGVTDYLRMNYR